MNDFPTEWDMEEETNDAWAVDERQPQGLHFTQMVAPSFDGRIFWFVFGEAIDDWLDITTLAPDKWAPSFESKTGRICQHIQARLGQGHVKPSK